MPFVVSTELHIKTWHLVESSAWILSVSVCRYSSRLCKKVKWLAFVSLPCYFLYKFFHPSRSPSICCSVSLFYCPNWYLSTPCRSNKRSHWAYCLYIYRNTATLTATTATSIWKWHLALQMHHKTRIQMDCSLSTNRSIVLQSMLYVCLSLYYIAQQQRRHQHWNGT